VAHALDWAGYGAGEAIDVLRRAVVGGTCIGAACGGRTTELHRPHANCLVATGANRMTRRYFRLPRKILSENGALPRFGNVRRRPKRGA
jgi:hypothetical protein